MITKIFEIAEYLGLNPSWDEINRERFVIIKGISFAPHRFWKDAGILKDKFVIGSEGGSAWAWFNGEVVGVCASTELEAITLTAYKVMLKYKELAASVN